MLKQRLKWWTNINLALFQRLVFVGFVGSQANTSSTKRVGIMLSRRLWRGPMLNQRCTRVCVCGGGGGSICFLQGLSVITK